MKMFPFGPTRGRNNIKKRYCSARHSFKKRKCKSQFSALLMYFVLSVLFKCVKPLHISDFVFYLLGYTGFFLPN